MQIATIQTGKLEAVKAALSARGSWGRHVADSLREGKNEVGDDAGETLADVALEVCGLDVADAECGSCGAPMYRGACSATRD